MSTIKSFITHIVSKKCTSVLACIFAGILGALPYFNESLFIFTFISLTLLFSIIIYRRKTENKVFRFFFSYFVGFYTPLYSFLSEIYPYERFGFTDTQAVFVLICSCVFIPLLHALVFGAILSFSKLLPNDAVYSISFASLWVIGEWVLSLGSMAFPWGVTAVSLTGFLPYLQTVSLFGVYFITFVTVLSCVLFAYAIVNKARVSAYIAIIIIAANTISGAILYFIPTEKQNEIKIAAIQGNALSNEKWNSQYAEDIFDRYITLTSEAAENGAEIIILPESAFPHIFIKNGYIHKSLADIAIQHNVTILSGVRYLDDGEFNSCFAVLPDGTLSEGYHKRHLVPFGEFIPFADSLGLMFPFIAEFNESSSSFKEGTEATVIETKYGGIAPLVCFDSIFSRFASEGVANGARFIAVVTNDSWFNDSAGIYTHLRHSQIRAIENRRYVMRSANTGISAIIDEKGNIINKSEPLTVDTVSSNVYPLSTLPFYHTVGDLILYLSFIFIIVYFIYANKKCRS